MTTSPLRLAAVTLLGLALGLLTVLILPYLFVAWLSAWLSDPGAPLPHRCERETRVLCDGGEGQPAADLLEAWIDGWQERITHV